MLSSFILYKNKYNLSPQVARQKYKQEPEEVYSSCFTFFNDQVDNTSIPVSAVNDPETKLCPYLNNVTNNPTSLEQPFFQTSYGNLMTQNVTSFHLDHDF
ncbi:11945_t:CDS:2 [Gigaspora margarita]|uniref:11945_t:CDS:1 n=1 Tax=Gigaspora margarita TaxID=4874 RepID=A0ABN7UPL0_GIGMA|nr:11945_t:CDS:2 [Gigaspora margarita]